MLKKIKTLVHLVNWIRLNRCPFVMDMFLLPSDRQGFQPVNCKPVVEIQRL